MKSEVSRWKFVLLLVLLMCSSVAGRQKEVAGRQNQGGQDKGVWQRGPSYTKHKDDGWCLSKIAMAVGGGVAAVVAAPVVLPALGFGATITAGSVAASAMSTAAVLNGGGVAAGGVIAGLQAAGAAGIGLAGNAALAATGAAVGVAVSEAMGTCEGPKCPDD